MFVSGTELRTDGQTDRQTDRQTNGQPDDPITRCPGGPFRRGGIKMAKISMSTYDPAPPQGHVMSVKCEEPIDELTAQVWLLYDHPNFKYYSLFVSGTELQTDSRQTIRLLDAPGGPFRQGA